MKRDTNVKKTFKTSNLETVRQATTLCLKK